MFLLLKHASATSQVTLVTCSGAFTKPPLRKVYFSLVKPSLFGANVSKTPVPQVAAFTTTPPPAGPWGEPSRYLLVMFSFFFRILSQCHEFFCTSCSSWGPFSRSFSSLWLFSVFFSVFELPRAPPDPKKPLKSLYSRRFSRFRQNEQSSVLRPLWAPSGVTFGPFLDAVGLPEALWADPGRPKGRQSPEKN